MTTKSYIIYKDIAVGAEDDAVITATGGTVESDAGLLLEGVNEYPYISLELNRWIGDGSFLYKEDIPEAIAYESAALSGDNGELATQLSFTITTGSGYSSAGISLVMGAECYAEMHVRWMRDSTVIYENDFPIYDGQGVAEHDVTNYNKVVITISKLSLPGRRFRAYSFVFGIVHRIDKGELRSISINNECDVRAESLPASTLSWELDSEQSPKFMFQTLQPVSVYHENTLIGVYYLTRYKRVSMTLYKVECEDAIGVLDRSDFAGGVYNNYSAAQLLRDILGGMFELDIQCDDVRLTGILQPDSRRNCIQQVIFAMGAVLTTDGTNKLRVFNNEIKYHGVLADRTFYGVNVESESAISSVTLVAHSYTPDENGGIEINGVKYADVETAYTKVNPKYDRNIKENAINISNATLVSTENAQVLLDRLYDLEMMRASISSDFVWQGEKLGDYLTQYTPWLTMASGYAESVKVKLSNTVVVSCKTRSYGVEAIAMTTGFYSGEVESGEE